MSKFIAKDFYIEFLAGFGSDVSCPSLCNN